jgi:hypothetical protein
MLHEEYNETSIVDVQTKVDEAKDTVNQITTLYRPVGQQELDLIRDSNFRSFPPRLPEQPIFYPVLNEAKVCTVCDHPYQINQLLEFSKSVT